MTSVAYARNVGTRGAEANVAAILLAEDDEAVRTFVTRALTHRGHSVVAVNDGQAAIRALEAQTFDLMLTDIVMPGLDGVALAEKAYAQLNESGWIGQDGVNSYPGIEFGWPASAFSHLSGKSASNRSFSMYLYTDAMVKSILLNDISGGKAIVVATKDGGTDADVVGNHAYQLVGYNSSTDRFELYNPHGANGSRPVRLFLTFAQLKKNCTQWTAVTL